MREIAIVDYHKGNLSSVRRGIEAAGGVARVTDDPELVARAEGIVMPGVGSFENAMRYMRTSGQAEAILEAIGRGVPFLGICLGIQVLFERGSEVDEPGPELQWVEGLGVFRGSSERLESSRLKVPHVGWDQIDVTPRGRECPLLAGVAEGCTMYFTHSYAVDATEEPDIIAARTHYARSFASVVWRDNVYGVQFHPEKSSGSGLTILRNFVQIVG